MLASKNRVLMLIDKILTIFQLTSFMTKPVEDFKIQVAFFARLSCSY